MGWAMWGGAPFTRWACRLILPGAFADQTSPGERPFDAVARGRCCPDGGHGYHVAAFAPGHTVRIGMHGISGQAFAIDCFVFALAVFVGFEMITKVPAILHTPLMSATNAIHGIVLVGAIAVAAVGHDAISDTVAVVAVF